MNLLPLNYKQQAFILEKVKTLISQQGNNKSSCALSHIRIFMKCQSKRMIRSSARTLILQNFAPHRFPHRCKIESLLFMTNKKEEKYRVLNSRPCLTVKFSLLLGWNVRYRFGRPLISADWQHFAKHRLCGLKNWK